MKSLAAISALLALASPAFLAPYATAAPWAGVRGDLPQDPALVLGSLPNGLRYALLPNATPANRVFLRLLVSAGSLHENDDERGIAHFLEHMAFRSTQGHPRSDLIPALQKAGISFGPDVNGSTTFDHTRYMLDLPDASEKNIRDALRVFRDFACDIEFDPAAIATERGVILAEMSTRDTGQQRAAQAYNNFTYPAARENSRAPIGLEKQIRKFTPQQFRAFYDAWYRPERMAVIVVGDIDPAAVAKLIADEFGPLAPRAPARAEPPPTNTQPPPVIPKVGVFTDKQIPNIVLNFFNIRLKSNLPPAPPREARIRTITQDLALAMLGSRLNSLAMQPGTSTYLGMPTAARDMPGPGLERVSVRVCASMEKWWDSVTLFEQTLRATREHGFTQIELDDAKTRASNLNAQAMQSAPTRKSDALATQLIAMFMRGDAFVTPETHCKAGQEALANITLPDCNAAYAEMWDAPTSPRLFIQASDAFSSITKDTQIMQCLYGSRQFPVTPPTVAAKQAGGDMHDQTQNTLRPPGHVVTTRQVPEIDATLMKLDNNVLLNFKRTDFEKNKVHVLVSFGNGRLDAPPEQPGLAAFAGAAFIRGGLESRSYGEIQQQLSLLGQGSIGCGTNTHRTTLRVTCPPAYLEDYLKILADYFSAPGYRNEGRQQAHTAIQPPYAAMRSSASANLTSAIIKGDLTRDPRLGLPAQREVAMRTMDEARRWLAPALANSGIEIAIVGDISHDDALAATLKTFGTLPARPECAAFKPSGDIKFVEKLGGTITKTIDPTIKQAAFACVWPLPTDTRTAQGKQSSQGTRVSSILAAVITNAMQACLREQLGVAYVVKAAVSGNAAIPNCDSIIATAEVAPAMLNKAIAAVRESLWHLAREGVSETDFARAKNPAVEKERQSLRNNDYWLGSVLNDAQTNPENLESRLAPVADYESITREEVNALAARLLDFDKGWLFKAVPGK